MAEDIKFNLDEWLKKELPEVYKQKIDFENMVNNKYCQTETELAWLAGFFDGEGNLGLHLIRNPRNVNRPNFGVKFEITNTDKTTLDTIWSKFGGSLVERKLKEGTNHKREYRWSLTDKQKIAKMIKAIFPYLKTKYLRASVLLDYIEKNPKKYGGGIFHKRTDEEFSQQEAMYLFLKKLNERGINNE